MAILEVCNVQKSYGSGEARVEALRGVSATINAGEFVAIMGPSGSGKSTLLAILGGIESPTSGKVLVEGVDLAQISEDERTKLRRRRLGFVFQSFNLLPNLTAEENVSLPMELDGMRGAKVKEKALHALELVEMTHRRTHLPSALSGAGGDCPRPSYSAGDSAGGRTDWKPRFAAVAAHLDAIGTLGSRARANDCDGNT